METLIPHTRFNLVLCRNRRLSIRGNKNIVKISMTLVFLVFMTVVVSVAAIPSTRAYPSDALFAQQINQTLESIIHYSQASKIQRYINNDPSNLEQVIQQLIWQIYRTSNLDQTSQVVNEINRQVTANPEGFTADSILWFAQRTANGQTYSVSQAIGNVAPPPSPADSISSFNSIAVNDATYYGDAAQTVFQGARAIAGASPAATSSSGSSSDQNQSDQNHHQTSMMMKMKNNTNTESITRVLGQTILGTALENGPGSAKQVLVQLTKELISNPKGFTAHLVLAAASEDAKGNFHASSEYISHITNKVTQSVNNQSRQLSCPVGLQPAASGNCQNTGAQLHPAVKGPNTAVSTAVKGPNTAVKGPNTAVKGPNTAVKGPNTAVKGPNTAVKGPNTAVRGPNTTTDGVVLRK